MKKHPLKVFWVPLLLFVFLAPTAWAQNEPSGLTLEVTGGFDSLYKSEYWLPITVTLANSGAPIEGEVRVFPRAAPSEDFMYRAPISLPTQSNKRVTLYIQLPGLATRVLVQLVDGKGTVIASAHTTQLTRVANGDLFYGVVSPDPGEFAFLENVAGSRSDANVAFLRLTDLPDVAVAWHALDVLVLNDTDTAQLTAEQLAALEVWVSTGGQLVVTGGASWQKTAVPLQTWLPVTLAGSETVADLPGLVEEMGIPFRDPGPYVVTTSSLARGELLFHEAGLPLLAQVPHGRGVVYFLALDPRFAPLLDWDGAEVMFAAVANRLSPPSLWGVGPEEGYAAQGAVTSLLDVNLPSVWQLVGFLLLYTVAVGPANYFILKRRKRLERAWITLPLMIVAFTTVTYFTGFQMRGSKAIINQLAVAYSQADGSQARIYSLVGLYSPRRSTYDLIFPSDTLVKPLANVFTSPTGADPNATAITYAAEHSVDGVRVDVSDIETFTAQTARPAIDIAGQGVLNQEGGFLRIKATIQNNSSITLEDAALLFGGTAVSMGDIQPGQTETVSQIVRGSSTSTGTAYGTYNAPLSGQADVLLGYDYYNDAKLYPRFQFFQALEGEGLGGSTGLSLPRSNAVLIGWSKEPQIEISLDKGAVNYTSTTLYFIEIPLTQNLTAGLGTGTLVLPTFLLEWSALPDSTVGNPKVTYLQLEGGQASFEYQPGPEFQALAVTELALLLEKEPYTEMPVPDVSLWNWQAETWESQTGVGWGETAVANPAAYIGPGNTVRIQLVDTDNKYSYGAITAVYPLLTMNLDN